MISIDDFEGSKENINTVRKGRKLATLATMNNEKERKLREQRLNDSSTLEEFVDYIDWTLQNFPSGHSSVMKKTEQVCRLYRKDPRYKNHPRYVELWLSVLKHQKDPSDLFKYLIKNEIGQELTIFYEQYAGFHESYHRFDEADEIYRLGISKKAVPVERLVRLYNEFLLRREEFVPEQVEEPVLKAPKKMPSKSQSKKAITVFQGDDEVDLQQDLFPQGVTSDYVDRLHPTKENEPSREAWAGTTLKMASKISTAPKVSVYRDEALKREQEEVHDPHLKKAKVLHGKEMEQRNGL
jgi:checkpoint serine/threonine-protein kinase